MTPQSQRDELRALADAATGGPWPENVAFTEAARTAIPALLDDVERLERERDALAAKHEPIESEAYRRHRDEAARSEERATFARFLLDIGYGTDFNTGPTLPSVPVLEEMVRLAADDPSFVAGLPEAEHAEAAYFVLSSELGDWRAAA